MWGSASSLWSAATCWGETATVRGNLHEHTLTHTRTGVSACSGDALWAQRASSEFVSFFSTHAHTYIRMHTHTKWESERERERGPRERGGTSWTGFVVFIHLQTFFNYTYQLNPLQLMMLTSQHWFQPYLFTKPVSLITFFFSSLPRSNGLNGCWSR